MVEPKATRTAKCACGQFQLTLAGEPQVVSSCNCFACQARTGSVFGVTAFFERSQLQAAVGNHSTFERTSDTDHKVSMHFCPACGSTLYWELEIKPGSIGVAAGCFTDPGFPAPVRNVWGEQKHHWVEFPDSINRYPRNPE